MSRHSHLATKHDGGQGKATLFKWLAIIAECNRIWWQKFRLSQREYILNLKLTSISLFEFLLILRMFSISEIFALKSWSSLSVWRCPGFIQTIFQNEGWVWSTHPQVLIFQVTETWFLQRENLARWIRSNTWSTRLVSLPRQSDFLLYAGIVFPSVPHGLSERKKTKSSDENIWCYAV